MTNCSVCCDTYTTITRKPILCTNCSYEACGRCVRTFLLSTTSVPHCMNCRHVWNREFLDAHLTRAWREGELKRHRASFLFDRERSMLPATQEAVEIELQKRAVAIEYEANAYKLIELKKAVAELEVNRERQQYFMRYGTWPGISEEIKTTRRQFIAACPAADCRGFLSTTYKCGTCQHQFCSDCRELKTETHICDSALVDTIKAITKDSRPCPSCGTAISKVSGCDQMYCTQCDTPFSYSTGERINGTIHNPHYVERLQKLGVAQTPIQGCLEGLPPYVLLQEFTQIQFKPLEKNIFRKLYQATVHVQEVVMQWLPNPSIPADNIDLRVGYLLKELDEHKFQLLLQQRDRKRQRDIEIRDCLGLFVELCTDFYRAFFSRSFINKAGVAPELDALVKNIEDHVNTPLRSIGDRYANIVPQIIMESTKGTTYPIVIRSYYVAQGYRPIKKIETISHQSPLMIMQDQLPE